MFITNQRPDFVMNKKYNSSSFSLFSFRVKAITFAMIVIIIVTGISFVSSLILNQNQTAIAQQQLQQQEQPLVTKNISFDIDNVSFSHHMASVNGVQLHYVIGGHGDPVVLLHGCHRHGINGVMLCQLWLKIILL
jgi:hypothetical protein